MITSKGVYGLSAMFELYLLKSDKPTQIKEISEITNIPQNYLEQLLNTLKKAKFLKSVRGAHGGYILKEGAEGIKVIDILEALEGDIVLFSTTVSNPILELFWSEGNESLQDIFNLTLKDLEEYNSKLKSSINFVI